MNRPQKKYSASKRIFVGVSLLLLVGIFFNTGCGYGKVSERSYKVATALYGACLAKSEARLEKISQLIDQDETADNPIPSHELAWLASIVKQAQDGEWESAAAAAKRMMKDQVEY